MKTRMVFFVSYLFLIRALTLYAHFPWWLGLRHCCSLTPSPSPSHSATVHLFASAFDARLDLTPYRSYMCVWVCVCSVCVRSDTLLIIQYPPIFWHFHSYFAAHILYVRHMIKKNNEHIFTLYRTSDVILSKSRRENINLDFTFSALSGSSDRTIWNAIDLFGVCVCITSRNFSVQMTLSELLLNPCCSLRCTIHILLKSTENIHTS